MEDECSEEETDDDAASAYHRNYGYHGSVHAEGIEVCKVGSGEEYADEDDAPVPVEGGGVLVIWPPEEKEHGEHNEELVDVVPRLHGKFIETDAVVLR